MTTTPRLQRYAFPGDEAAFQSDDGGWVRYDEALQAVARAAVSAAATPAPQPLVMGNDRGFMPKFALGDRVRKTKGSSWQGRIVGFYSTALTPVGYAVESERESGSVQIYPEAAIELLTEDGANA
jgi:hypothetical protein